MLHLLWLVPFLPFASFLLLVLAGRKLSDRAAASIGIGSVGVSALIAILIGISWVASPPAEGRFVQELWRWVDLGGAAAGGPSAGGTAAGGLSVGMTLWLDPLSLLMTLVVTFVGFLIHAYSSEYMRGEAGYAKFFAYMNLFVGAMLALVLADNYLLLYLGWEGVGLCSYLLIGFWYRDPANGRAARKAFIVTRVGDTAMALGLFLLFWSLGTLDIHDAMERARTTWTVGAGPPVLAAALLLGGALGKSAQLPLHTWLPDAMAGPTPVSALIHAATMVTAGVYLIARSHVLFELAPDVQLAVAIIGAATLLVSGLTALVQSDIKRVLAWSTISQIGYMFLALGVGAWAGAMFHFMTHAFFKALLFLAAGAVILAVHHEQNIFKMGGLARRLPVVFWTFLAGAAALSAIPLVTAGFYSKELILSAALGSHAAGKALWTAGVVGAFITSVYTFRLVFIVFFGAEKAHVAHPPGRAITVPLAVLAVLSVIGGFVETPPGLGGVTLFSGFLGSVFGAAGHGEHHPELASQAIAVGASLSGVLVAWILFVRLPGIATALAVRARAVHRFLASGWRFDALYDLLFVRPLVLVARVNRGDFVDRFFRGIAGLVSAFHAVLSWFQNGRVRRYAVGLAFGAAIVIAIAVLS